MAPSRHKKKPITFPLSKIVVVRWRDACTRSGWDDMRDYMKHGPEEIETCGYLLRKDDKEIVVATTQSASGDANGCIAIPKSWVVKMTIVRK